MSDDAVQAKTGKTWPEWFSLLDAAGARGMTHKEIVAYLSGQHAVGPWWQQTVTVAYEQARGMRQKHEKPDGYEVSRSKTLAVPVPTAFTAWTDKRQRARWLKGAELTIRKANEDKSLRITWSADETHVDVNFYPKGQDRTQVTVQHRKLPDAAQGERMKAFWGEALDRLQELLER
jgi:uncharacterized protein YndB with AHSA1/START domain